MIGHRLVQISMFFKENKIFIFKICLFSIENTTKQMLVIFQKRRGNFNQTEVFCNARAGF